MRVEVVLEDVMTNTDVDLIDFWDNLTNNEQRALLKAWIEEGKITTVQIKEN